MVKLIFPNGVTYMDWLHELKRIKNEKGIKNDELAERSGIPLGTLNKLLAGQTGSVKLSTIIALAEALQVSLSELIGADGYSDDEKEFIKKLRTLDGEGFNNVSNCLQREYARTLEARKKKTSYEVEDTATVHILFYDVPVSAGCGYYLDSDKAQKITLTSTPVTERADFAIRVSGDSMEPKFSNGDIVIVESGSDVQVGEIGIFVINGEGYIKKFGSDRLISLNPAYSDIKIKPDDSFECKGLVLGKLKKSL